MEHYWEARAKLKQFHDAFAKATGSRGSRNEMPPFPPGSGLQALSDNLGQRPSPARNGLTLPKQLRTGPGNFCNVGEEYLDAKGPETGNLLVDEGWSVHRQDEHLMLNLQTITEDLGTTAAVGVDRRTSQEPSRPSSGEMRKTKENDFSKIQAG